MAFFEAEIGRDKNSKHSNMLLTSNNIRCKLQRSKTEILQQSSRAGPEQLGLVRIQLEPICRHPVSAGLSTELMRLQPKAPIFRGPGAVIVTESLI